MSVGRTDIANLALNHIGEPPIMKLIDKDNATARIVLVVFDAAIREIVSPFCTRNRVKGLVIGTVVWGRP